MAGNSYPELAGKVAVVTGSTGGIGRAVAEGLAREGCRVVVNGTSVERGEAVAEGIRGAGGEATFFAADVTDAGQVRALIAAAVDSYGRLDLACNNAGHEGMGPITHTYTEELWDATMAVNLTGTFLCMKHEIIEMLGTRGNVGGAIVNVASIAGMVGGASPAYNASKHGVIGLTKQAALEYARRGIRVNAVCPSIIRTPLLESVFVQRPEAEEQWMAAQPNGRFGSPEEVSGAVLWLCSEGSSFVTGHALAVDGGWLAQ